jgi:zinc transport system substrate-binding protein
MRKTFFLLLIAFTVSCGRQANQTDKRIITVSIAPFKYFVEAIGGDDFTVNVMVSPGADPHTYEPYPDQVTKLGKSSAYISNGYMGFEKTWLSRYHEINKSMKMLTLGENVNLISSDGQHNRNHGEWVDPHFWISPKSGLVIASSVKDLLCDLNPGHCEQYESNYQTLVKKIDDLDIKARKIFSGLKKRSFLIYHPDLSYLARDYNLDQVPVEYEGKEPSPLRMKELIDLAKKDNLKTIFVQREFDSRNAETIAEQVGAEVKIIDPLSEEWLKTTSDIISSVYDSLVESSKQP